MVLSGVTVLSDLWYHDCQLHECPAVCGPRESRVVSDFGSSKCYSSLGSGFETLGPEHVANISYSSCNWDSSFSSLAS